MKDGFLRSFRLVCPPQLRPSVCRLLRAEAFEFEAEPFSPFCYRLLKEPAPLGSSLAAFFGYIYIQDRSSMLPPLALAPDPGSAVLDICASPGSKTGMLAQLVGQDGFVLANEPSSSRLATLRANMRQLGLPQVATCGYSGADLPLFPASWNYILLDPPCSGWGTEKRNPRVRKLWQGKKIDQLVKIQRRLLRHAASLLAPEGRLLYSTCTTNPAENECQTLFALEELELEELALDPFPGFEFQEAARGVQALLVDGDSSGAQGFYLSLLRKKASGEISESEKIPACEDHYAGGSFCQQESLDLAGLPPGSIGIFGNRARFLPAQAFGLLPQNFGWQAFPLGTYGKKGAFMPDSRLKQFFPADSPRLQIDDLAAIRSLLRGQELRLDSRLQGARGLYWEDLPLGRVQLRHGRVIASFGVARP